jgi:hypothetical protein
MYHVPPGTHADYAAIDVLVALINRVLRAGCKALVESGLASSAFGYEQQQHEAGFAYFGASVRQGQPLDAARDALVAALEGFASNPVTEDEVTRARIRLLNDIELGLASSRSLARLLSETAAMGDWRMLFLHRDRVRQVSAADVQRVAIAYFKSSNRTLGMFLPTGTPDRAEIPSVPDVAAVLKDYRGAGPVAKGEAFDPTPENIEARVIRRALAGGMKLALLPKKTRGGTVVARLGLRWGDESSKLGRSTACGIASAMLMRGTKKRTREQLSNEFARLKANVDVGGEGGSSKRSARACKTPAAVASPARAFLPRERIRAVATILPRRHRDTETGPRRAGKNRTGAPPQSPCAGALALQPDTGGARGTPQVADAGRSQTLLHPAHRRFRQRAHRRRRLRPGGGRAAGCRAVRRLEEPAPYAHSTAPFDAPESTAQSAPDKAMHAAGAEQAAR